MVLIRSLYIIRKLTKHLKCTDMSVPFRREQIWMIYHTKNSIQKHACLKLFDCSQNFAESLKIILSYWNQFHFPMLEWFAVFEMYSWLFLRLLNFSNFSVHEDFCFFWEMVLSASDAGNRSRAFRMPTAAIRHMHISFCMSWKLVGWLSELSKLAKVASLAKQVELAEWLSLLG
jgi:hypothetical protein